MPSSQAAPKRAEERHVRPVTRHSTTSTPNHVSSSVATSFSLVDPEVWRGDELEVAARRDVDGAGADPLDAGIVLVGTVSRVG